VSSGIYKSITIREIYFSHRRTSLKHLLTLNWRNIPLVNSVKYLGVTFDKKITWTLHIERIEAKVLRTFIRYIPFSRVRD
jgi:hypothetical protein